MTHAETIRLIDRGFEALQRYVGDPHGAHFAILLDLLTSEERDNRKAYPEKKYKTTVYQAVKMFAVRNLAQLTYGDRKAPTAGDWFHVNQSLFAAAAIVELHADDLLKAYGSLGLADLAAIRELDYRDII